VSPAKWKRALGLSDAETSRAKAIETWPTQAGLFARKRDHNRAEAALLGLYGLKHDAPPMAEGLSIYPRADCDWYREPVWVTERLARRSAVSPRCKMTPLVAPFLVGSSSARGGLSAEGVGCANTGPSLRAAQPD
jgi:hypothetical protein